MTSDEADDAAGDLEDLVLPRGAVGVDEGRLDRSDLALDDRLGLDPVDELVDGARRGGCASPRSRPRSRRASVEAELTCPPAFGCPGDAQVSQDHPRRRSESSPQCAAASTHGHAQPRFVGVRSPVGRPVTRHGRIDRVRRTLHTTEATMSRLEPGDTAPDFTLPADTGDEVTPLGPARPQGDRVLLPGRDDARLHQRRPATSPTRLDSLQAAGYEVLGISPDKPEKLAKFRERDGLTITAAVRRGRPVLRRTAPSARRSSTARPSQGVIRSTFVVDEDGQGRARAVQRQGHRPRRQAAPRPRRLSSS